jgi:hypothetical protein
MLDPKFWPSWRYGPNGEAAIFERPEDVPDGWSAVVSFAAAAPEPATEDQAPAKRGPGRPKKG